MNSPLPVILALFGLSCAAPPVTGVDGGPSADVLAATDSRVDRPDSVDPAIETGPVDSGTGDSGAGEVADSGPDTHITGDAGPTDAQPLFVFDPERAGAENAHENGGYFFLAGDRGAEANNTNLAIVDVDDDPLYAGPHRAFRNTYYPDGGSCTPERCERAYSNHVMFIDFPERAKFYLRARIRFSENWVFGSSQLKFSKNRGRGESRVSSNTWFDHNGDFLATFNGGLGQVYLFANWYGDPMNRYREGDDINNGFGAGGSDANWSPTLGQWHWVEWELDADAPGSDDGSIRMWVDGRPYISRSSIQLSASPADSLFTRLEFGGHVWEDDTPPHEIYLEFHRVEVFTEWPGPPPGL